jgi:four helix bundle protein
LYRSRGSICELLDDFNVCEDEEYFTKVQLDDIRVQAIRVQKLINGYIKYLKDRPVKDEM